LLIRYGGDGGRVDAAAEQNHSFFGWHKAMGAAPWCLPSDSAFRTSRRYPRRELSCSDNRFRRGCHRPDWPGDEDMLNKARPVGRVEYFLNNF
jgi:hypothetical protein